MNDDPITETPTSIPELEKFIFRADRFTRGVVPRKLDPAEVAKFLLERIDEKTEFKYFTQVEKAATFYDVFEVAEKFRGFLNRKEAGSDELRRSIIIARIVARVGNPEDVEFAKQYYVHLVSRADSLVEFKDVILLHDVLGLGSDSGALRAKLQSKMAALEAKKGSDEQARIEYLEFQGEIQQELTRAEKAGAVKEQILSLSNRRARLEEEIKAYLGIEYGFLEYLEPWAAMRLRRETWAPDVARQIVRDEKAPLRADVANSFREFLPKLDTFDETSDDAEEKEALEVKILRAIKFFGGEVSEQEEELLDQYKGTQADILADEGFQLPAPR